MPLNDELKNEYNENQVLDVLEENKTDNEEKELTEEEKRKQYIDFLKSYKLKYKPKKQFTNKYRKDRQRRNKQQKQARRHNRKK